MYIRVCTSRRSLSTFGDDLRVGEEVVLPVGPEGVEPGRVEVVDRLRRLRRGSRALRGVAIVERVSGALSLRLVTLDSSTAAPDGADIVSASGVPAEGGHNQ